MGRPIIADISRPLWIVKVTLRENLQLLSIKVTKQQNIISLMKFVYPEYSSNNYILVKSILNINFHHFVNLNFYFNLYLNKFVQMFSCKFF